MPNRPKVLIASTHTWDAALQVGTHQLGRQFVREGWDVCFVSAPLSPLHTAMKSRVLMYDQRMGNHRAGGQTHEDGRVWSYVPWAFLTPDMKPGLNSRLLAEQWHRLSMPNVVETVHAAGFGEVDLVFFDGLFQTFWLDKVHSGKTIYRMRDDNNAIHGFSAGLKALERQLVRSVDATFYTANGLEKKLRQWGAGNIHHLPNGVEYEHFATPQPAPSIYSDIPGPKVVYAGAMDWRFDFSLVEQAARQLPETAFILIGPKSPDTRTLTAPNIHLLGTIPYQQLPGYLQHADVGIIPFDRSEPEKLAAINPLKAYQYMAAGLPYVAMGWEELPAGVPNTWHCRSAAEFIQGVKLGLMLGKNGSDMPAHARRNDWAAIFQKMISILQS